MRRHGRATARCAGDLRRGGQNGGDLRAGGQGEGGPRNAGGPPDDGKTGGFFRKLAAFGALMAVLSSSARVFGCRPIPIVDSFSGTLNGTSPTGGTVSSFSFGGGSGIITPTTTPPNLLGAGGFTVSTTSPPTVGLGSYNAGTTLGATVSDRICKNGTDTIDFTTLSSVTITNLAIPVGGGQFFYYGIIGATVPAGDVIVTGPDQTELQGELSDFISNGGGLVPDLQRNQHFHGRRHDWLFAIGFLHDGCRDCSNGSRTGLGHFGHERGGGFYLGKTGTPVA